MRNIGEKGMIAVETMISFLGLLFVTVIIIFFVNITALQVRVHHALAQTAKEVSVYAYLFEIAGTTGGEEGQSSGDLSAFLSGASDILKLLTGGDFPIGSKNPQIENVLNKGKNGISSSYTDVKNAGKNPGELFATMLTLVLTKSFGSSYDQLFGFLVAPAIFDRYLEVTGVNPDAQSYLRGIGVFMDGYNQSDPKKGLTFITLSGSESQGSHLLANGSEIVIRVEYYYDFTTFLGILPKEYSKLKIVQQVKTRAWIGDGKYYSPLT